MGNKITYVMEVDDSDFTATVKDAQGNVQKLEDILKKTGETGTKANKDMTQTMKDLGQAYIGLKTFLTDAYTFTKAFTDASIAQTQATKNLTDEQVAYADVLEEQTGVNDTIIAQAETSLKVMGLNTEQVKQATKYTADLVAGGLSLEDSMKKSAAMVTKNYGELGELIPSIKMATTEQEKQSLATEYFTKKAELAIQSMDGIVGAEKRTANAMEDAKAKFGAVLNESLLPILEAMPPLIDFLGNNLPVVLGVVSTAVVAKAIPAMIALVTQIRAVGVATAFATGGLSAVGGILGSLAIAGGTAWLGYTAATKEAATTTELTANSVASLSRNLSWAKSGVRGLEDQLKQTSDKLKEIENLGSPIDRYAESINLLKDQTRLTKELSDERARTGKIEADLNAAKKALNAEEKAAAKEKEDAAKSLAEQQKKANETGIALAKTYQDQLALIGLEGVNKQLKQEEINNENTIDNLDKLLQKKELSYAGHHAAIELQSKLHGEKIKEIETDDAEKTAEEVKAIRLKQVEDDIILSNLRVDTAQSVADEIIAIDQSLLESKIDLKVSGNEILLNQVTDLQVANQLIQAEYDAQIASHQALVDEKKISEEQYTQWKEAFDKSTAKRREKADDDEWNRRKAGLKNLEGDLKTASKMSSEFAKAAKVVAIANTTIATYESAQLAFKSFAGIPVVGVPLGIAAATAAVIAGLANVAEITSTSTGFATGGYDAPTGYTGTGNMYEPAGTVYHKGEFITNAPTTQRIGVDNLYALQRGDAVVVPVSAVASRSFEGSASNNSISALSNDLAINNSLMNDSIGREVIVINNSDFVTVTKMVDRTYQENPDISSKKYIGGL